jgi:hypothetical protein
VEEGDGGGAVPIKKAVIFLNKALLKKEVSFLNMTEAVRQLARLTRC